MNIDPEIAALTSMLREMPELADDQEALVSAIESETDLFEALNRLILSSNEDNADAEARGRLADAYQAAKGRLEHRAKRKLDAVASIMARFNIRRADLAVGKVSCIRGKETVRVVEVDDLPQGFFEVETRRVAKMDEIRAAFDAGQVIPGALSVIGRDYIRVLK